MSRKFTLIKDYYDTGEILYKKKTVEIKPGLTVLVGCNGCGKTTFLHQLQASLKKQDIPCLLFDNLKEGGATAVSEAGFYDNIEFMATALCSSEGENITQNMAALARRLGTFVRTGKDAKYKSLLSLDKEKEEAEISDERWILLDAIDSGLSIDNVVDIKEALFGTILEMYKDNVYIVVSANEYEMAKDANCFDTFNGKYVTFKDYEDYRKFILASRDSKEERYSK